MLVPLSWLRDYVDIPAALDDLLERLTLAGLEVASVEHIGDWWDRERMVVGEVLEVRPHPNADRLVLADVAYGGPEIEQVVTGAPNLFPYKGAGAVTLKVAFAMEGAELYDGHKEGFVKTRLKATKIRGVPSRAMVCSEKELGISEEHEGIMFLAPDAPVGMPLADYLGDTILDLDLTPNLARCFNMIGVAREVSALTGARLRYSSTDWQADGPPAAELARVEIEDPQLCARYIATIIRDVEIGPAPVWMQSRVHKAGMRPISNVVDVTNYVMLEWGQPLHAFDYDKLVARVGGDVPTIIVRCARPGETMTTLDGVHRIFSEDTLLICDTAGPIAVAGVMGGLETEVDENTRNVLLEAANFDFISIRRTMQAMKLPSEASQRFGRGIHPAVAEPAARRASELMRLLSGGAIARGMVDNYPLPERPAVIELTAEEVQRQLGIRFGLEEIAAYLERLEFVCEPLDSEVLRVTVPDHRLDCQIPADLVEEVVRMYGYDRIPVTDLADRLPPQRGNPDLEREEAVRDALVACGMQEIITHSLSNLQQEAALRPGTRAEDLPAESYIVVANPISQDHSAMRHTLLASALQIAAANLRFGARVRLFEIGKVFVLNPGEELPEELLRLSLVASGSRQDRHWLAREGGETEEMDFFDLKGIVEVLLERLHVDGVAFEPVSHPTFQAGRAARLVMQDPEGEPVELGVLGELDPAVREAFDLPSWRVAAAELDLDALLARMAGTWRVEPISPYPAILQDLAVVVDDEVPAAAVQAAIVQAGGFLLREVRLFDVYRGEPVPTGKKSLAYALTFQAPDKTLRDEIVARQVKGIVRKLEQELGAEMRS